MVLYKFCLFVLRPTPVFGSREEKSPCSQLPGVPLRGRRCSGPRRSAERVRRPPQCLGGGLPFSVSRLSFCSAASTWGHRGDIRGRPAARCPPSTPHPHSPSTRADATQPAPPATRQHPDRAAGLPPTPSPHAGPRPRPGPGPLRPQLPRQLSPAP